MHLLESSGVRFHARGWLNFGHKVMNLPELAPWRVRFSCLNGVAFKLEPNMNAVNLLTQNRATLKLLFVAALSLGMAIPLMMVHSIIMEREQMQASAESTIAGRWGGNQAIGGLVALTRTAQVNKGDRHLEMGKLWTGHTMLDLQVDVNMTASRRTLGIYEVPVYTSKVRIRGRLNVDLLQALQPEGDLEFWLPIDDVRGIRSVSALRIGTLELAARPLGVAPELHRGLQFTLPAKERGALHSEYSIDLEVAGSRRLEFLPLADRTRVQLVSDWPHPEFIGQSLPFRHQITAEGVSAEWQLLGLNRQFGDQWIVSELPAKLLYSSAFGMRMDTPVDRFQRNERSVKYGFLFIVMTFFTLFLFEVMSKRPLHPVPYILTGSAMAVFYLVLLALSEYLSFGFAFAIAAALLVLIVSPYTGAVLGAMRRGYLAGLMMSLTYSLLYILVSADHLSLLLGSLSLLAAIASLMYMTRNVDWYSYGDNRQD
jgi:inner membrane protein